MAVNTPEASALLSLSVDEVRISAVAADHSFTMSSLTLLPFITGAELGKPTFHGQYTEEFELSYASPYTPSSPWRIALPESSLEGQDFSVWFVVTSKPKLGNLATEVFKDALPFVGLALLTVALTSTTPVPDEMVTAAGAVQSGHSLVGSVSAYGRQLLPHLRNAVLRQQAGGHVDDVAAALEDYTYIGEAHLKLPASENWYAGQQVLISTTDQALEILVSVNKTDAGPATENAQVAEASGENAASTSEIIPVVAISLPECSESFSTTLISGVAARVLINKPILTAISSTSSRPLTSVLPGDVVYPIVSYCDTANQTLWWRVTEPNTGEIGWLPEYTATERILESSR